MITVVSWKWRPKPGYRSEFTARAVNVHRAMFERFLPVRHEYVCITDDPTGIDPRVRVIPLWDDLADIPSPHGGNNPACYRRLKAFARDAGDWLGKRILSVDLDVVVTGDLRPLVRRPEEFVIWGDTNPTTHYNGGLWLLAAGARPQVWEKFDQAHSPRAARAAGQFGSDQGWISHCLGPGEARFGRRDGVYSFRNDLNGDRGQPKPLPQDARIVLFHGQLDPWDSAARARHPWIADYWRE